ncbi:coth protein-domain-containing protein [Radiomyces spectabilis]|uniref:coth protein-domain-containing protein n=1 Tax=Radiomyces spectabilis TaxID=64574 RepID=UPI00221F0D0A|nr:coth protein-domain-containing protein [Radiomyces spectabilis]KAI8388273.1 coth protein-domain-containing protein [Radiomyces spectabilis]
MVVETLWRVSVALEEIEASRLAVFKVISDTSKNPLIKLGVRLVDDPQVYVLQQSDLDPLLHVGSAPASKPYHYLRMYVNETLVDEEKFDRPASSAALHEFYGRQQTTIKQLTDHSLPSVFADEPKFKRLDSSIVHPKDEIPTLHVRTTDIDLQELYENYLEDFAIVANLTHISSGNIRFFEQAKFQLGGQTSRLFEKFSFNIHLAKQQGMSLGGYRKFKLRAAATDPTFIREKLYYDVLDAAGLPASHASYVRLFINEEPLGLYVLIDNYKNPFLKNVFGQGQKYKQGVLYQGSMPENPMAPGRLGAGATLAFYGLTDTDYAENGKSLYKVQQEGAAGSNGLKELIEFMEFINGTAIKMDTLASSQFDDLQEAWNARFDVRLFLKNIALEIIMGHVDGYLGAAHNFFLYQNPADRRFLWLSADLDQTMGNTMIPFRNTTSHNEPLTSLDRFDLMNSQRKRPLMRHIMRIPGFQAQFHGILKDIHQALFQPNKLIERMQVLVDAIRDDVAWDASIRKVRSSAFANDQIAQKHREQIQQKILQMPLGQDFLERINAIDFDAAVNGPLDGHPSLMPLRDWLREIENLLNLYVSTPFNVLI